MNFFYARPPGDGESLVVVRLVVGSAMLASIVLAVLAIRRREFTSDVAWMTRGYAIALGAGTRVFTGLPWTVIVGPIGASDELPPHGTHDGGLGDQPRRGRVRHSAARPPTHAHVGGFRPARNSARAGYVNHDRPRARSV
jgi:hypothetical protein